jgi:hypothetical protein
VLPCLASLVEVYGDRTTPWQMGNEREIGLHLFLIDFVVELPNTNNWTN